MKLHPVESSNIAALGHEGDKLQVKFHNGGLYEYEGVSEELFNNLRGAESVGKAFHQKVKVKGFKFKKLN